MLVRQLLVELGEDPEREGLLKTPGRVAAALEFLTSGKRADLKTVINDAIFTQETNSMVIVKNIEVYSLCEHHMLPFFGRCHIGYIPNGKVFGVSKLARLVDMYARRGKTELGNGHFVRGRNVSRLPGHPRRVSRPDRASRNLAGAKNRAEVRGPRFE